MRPIPVSPGSASMRSFWGMLLLWFPLLKRTRRECALGNLDNRLHRIAESFKRFRAFDHLSRLGLHLIGLYAMPMVQFIGRVLPAVIDFSFSNLPAVNWEDTEFGLTLSFTLSVQKSTIRIDCQTNKYEDTHLNSLYMRALDLARAVIDLACFSTGFGATVILDTFVKPDGQTLTLMTTSPHLDALCTAFRLGAAPNPDLTTVLGIVLKEPALFMAMNDLIVSITLPHHANVNCARAIDGIRNMIAPALPTNKSWEVLRDNLRLAKGYLKLITDTSIPPRHGDRSHIPGSTIMEISRRSWIIMDRFLEFRKRGNQPLPLAEFPLLT